MYYNLPNPATKPPKNRKHPLNNEFSESESHLYIRICNFSYDRAGLQGKCDLARLSIRLSTKLYKSHGKSWGFVPCTSPVAVRVPETSEICNRPRNFASAP